MRAGEQQSTTDPDDVVYTRVDDEQFAELSELCAQRVVHATVWDEMALSALDPSAAQAWAQDTFDIDLYLGDGVYFELFGVCCYPALDAEPLQTHEAVSDHLAGLVGSGVWLEEIAVDEDDSLVLVLARRHKLALFVAASGWSLHEWEELPIDQVPGAQSPS